MVYYNNSLRVRDNTRDGARLVKSDMGIKGLVKDIGELVQSIHKVQGNVNFVYNDISERYHEIEYSRIRVHNAMGINSDSNNQFTLDCVVNVHKDGERLTSDVNITRDIVLGIGYAYMSFSYLKNNQIFFKNKVLDNRDNWMADIFYKEFMMPEDIFRTVCDDMLLDGYTITNKQLETLSNIFNVNIGSIKGRGKDLGLFDEV